MRGVKDTLSLEPLVDPGRLWKTTSSPVYSKVCLYCAVLASLFSVGEQIEAKGLRRAHVPSTAMWYGSAFPSECFSVRGHFSGKHKQF